MPLDQHAFYLLSEIFIALTGSVLLLAIWSTIQRQFVHRLSGEISIKRIDKGLLYLSLSLFVWFLSALITFVSLPIASNGWILLLSQNIFSIFNSLFLILALFYLDNAPQYLYNNKKSTKRIILFFILLPMVSFLLAIIYEDTVHTFGIRISAIPDVVLSAVLSWFLIISLYRTFINRNMVIVAIISVFTILLLFLSQLPEVFYMESLGFYSDLMKIVSKTALISIFLVLGTSWVIELAQTTRVKEMKIHFTDWNQMVLSIPSKGILNEKIDFGKKTTQFNNLLKFAIRRKFAPEQNMCIEVYNGGEIPSQTYLSRIVDNLNAILDLDHDNKLHRNDVFTFIGQGKYRLRFLQAHIEIENVLLKEFVNNTDNQLYKLYLNNNN